MPPGADPHTYQPTPRDVQSLQGARLALWNGLGLDDSAADLVAEQGLPDLTVVVLDLGDVERDHLHRWLRKYATVRFRPSASGVRPPVGMSSRRAAAMSTEDVGGSASFASASRNVIRPTLSRRW